MYLADLGADIVKIERPGRGDDTRGWGPPFERGTSAWFASANRNKSSVAVDLQQPSGLSVLLRLLDSADVFIENMNPAKLTALGIDPSAVHRRNPRLVYCAMSGFGLDGPHHNLPGYDLIAQARSGLMSVTGEAGRSPQRVSTALSDVATGMCAAIAINAALVRQVQSGQGDVIDVSLLDTDLALMAPRIAAYSAGEALPQPSGGTDSVLAVYQSFPASDRTIVVAVGNDAMWRRFCSAVGLDHLARDSRFDDNIGRRVWRTEITDQVARVLVAKSAADWLSVFSAAGIPVSVVQSIDEVVKDPQVVARGSVMQVPGYENLIGVHSPFRLASIPVPRNERFPHVGEHTTRILRELGYADDEIRDLHATGAVATKKDACG